MLPQGFICSHAASNLPRYVPLRQVAFQDACTSGVRTTIVMRVPLMLPVALTGTDAWFALAMLALRHTCCTTTRLAAQVLLYVCLQNDNLRTDIRHRIALLCRHGLRPSGKPQQPAQRRTNVTVLSAAAPPASSKLEGEVHMLFCLLLFSDAPQAHLCCIEKHAAACSCLLRELLGNGPQEAGFKCYYFRSGLSSQPLAWLTRLGFQGQPLHH